MSKYLSIVFVLCMLLLKANAQNNLPPVYEINNDTIAYELLPDSCLQMLEDKEGNWTLEQVSLPPISNGFHPYQGTVDYSIHTSWFRCRLYNNMNNEAKIGFYGDLQNEYTDFFLQYSSGVHTQIAGGWNVPWSKKAGLKTIGFLPFVLAPHAEVIVYQRIYNGLGILPYSSFSVALGSTQKAGEWEQQNGYDDYNKLLDAFYHGFLAFAVLFNLLFFFIARERAYLYFALYALWIGLARYTDIADFFREYPYAVNFVISHLAFGIAAQFFQIHFIRQLVKSYQYVPRWDRWLVAFSFLPLAIHLASYLLPQAQLLQLQLPLLSYNFLNILALVTFLLVLQKQHWSDKPLLFAIFPAYFVWGSLFGSWMGIIVLRSFVPIPQTGFELWWSKWWSTFETFIIGWLMLSYSWILIRRFVIQRRHIQQLALEKETEKRLLIEQQKALLEQQVQERTAELKQSLENLKSTQAQLIQSEKMASLGELTAGIAHEIQNPLNFVNNFSDVNKELLEELKEEADKGNLEDVKAIATDLISNEEKINHHGKRAEAIVKGMLQHSRQTTGTKEITDINALADEYLRLAYHGLRAKDKNFNAEIKTGFDETIGNINIIPQDIGRVLLNLYNNAFYAVAEKKKQQTEGFAPTVSVSTKKIGDKIEIKVSDNGNGIPQKILDKIFQPFFTTKPTGQGTGLGLSLSYDIVKAHGGEIKVGSKEAEGTTFIIQLPVS